MSSKTFGVKQTATQQSGGAADYSCWDLFTSSFAYLVEPRGKSHDFGKGGKGTQDGSSKVSTGRKAAASRRVGCCSACLSFVSGLGRSGIFMVVFLTAYCAQPLLIDLIKLNGGAHSSTFLFLLPHYGSMMLVGLLPRSVALRDCDWNKAFILSAIDIVNQLLKKAGLVFAGAAVYIVIDSSSIVWTAIWSVVLLKRKLSVLQWCSIGLIFVGVAMKAFMLEVSFKNEEFIGVIFISVASMSMGLNFVLSEHFMLHQQKPIPGPNLVCMMGTCCTSVLTLWTLWWTLPRFDVLIRQPIARVGGSPQVIMIAFAVLLVTSTIHSSSFWYIIKSMGAISSGVLKGLKVASVFVLSHIFFCKSNPKQCLTPSSAFSAIVCVSGVIFYSTVTARLHKKHSAEAKQEDEAERLLASQGGAMSMTNLQTQAMSAGKGSVVVAGGRQKYPKALLRIESDEGFVHNSSMIFTHAARVTPGKPRSHSIGSNARIMSNSQTHGNSSST